jgi:hypothetical protein
LLSLFAPQSGAPEKPITSRAPVTLKFTADCTLVNTDISGNSRLRHSYFIKSVNLASVVWGQMAVGCSHFGYPSKEILDNLICPIYRLNYELGC